MATMTVLVCDVCSKQTVTDIPYYLSLEANDSGRARGRNGNGNIGRLRNKELCVDCALQVWNLLTERGYRIRGVAE